MHYDIDYSSYDNPLAKQAAALADVRDYLGQERFFNLVQEFRKVEYMPLERFTLLMSISGISGYPVRAFHEYIFPLQYN